jgi:hypothetical protein
MASNRKPKGGRVTPKGGGPSGSGRGSGGPQKPSEPTPQIGRRPSKPGFLFAIAAVWIVCGVVALVSLKANWKFIPGLVFIGIGLFYLRGAFGTVARHEERLDERDDSAG